MPASPKESVSGWGRIPSVGHEVRPEDFAGFTEGAVLSRGLARSYGDSSLPPPSHPEVVSSVRYDRILSFDDTTGELRAEAGLSLKEMNRLLFPRGWFTPVTPGTHFVTLGGMVAADVHGKSHHVDGCFGAHVTGLTMRVADGRVLAISPTVHADLFWATVGGMGLTGHILDVSVTLRRVPSPWMWVESIQVPDIDVYIDMLKESAHDWPFSMGWIDCLARGSSLGRGILMRGRWATQDEAPHRHPSPLVRPSVPFEFPSWAVSRPTVRLFNEVLYRSHIPRRKVGIQHPETFFYPLDAIGHWNRMYGPRGFTQYQCVLPNEAGRGAARRFLERLTTLGGASMLCVIKDCGPEGQGLLSFPKAGISIALDIPHTDGTQRLVDRLNELVIAEGGRIYLAKDQFTRAEHFRAMEPRLPHFLDVRSKWDPEGRLRSVQSIRLFGDRS